MFEIIGNDVLCEGYLVAKLQGGVPATVRQRVEDAITSCGDDLRIEIEELEKERGYLRAEVSEVRERITALAAILGVTP